MNLTSIGSILSAIGACGAVAIALYSHYIFVGERRYYYVYSERI